MSGLLLKDYHPPSLLVTEDGRIDFSLVLARLDLNYWQGLQISLAESELAEVEVEVEENVSALLQADIPNYLTFERTLSRY